MYSSARIVCIPSRDTSFSADVAEVAERIPDWLRPNDALGWFATELGRTYPTAAVREQDPLAKVEGEPPVWYVTRRQHHFRIDTAFWVPLPTTEAYRVYVDEMADWQTAVDLKPRQSNRLVVGAEFEASYPFMGRTYTGLLRILAADPGRSVSVEAEGSGISVWYVTSFRPERVGTQVRVKGDYELPDNILARIADRLGLERAIARDIDRANASYRAFCDKAAARAARRAQDLDGIGSDEGPSRERDEVVSPEGLEPSTR
jgi:hypothetical protein